MNITTTPTYAEHAGNLLTKFNVAGWSVAVPNLVEIQAKGFRLYPIESPVPATENAIYDIASKSKSLTAPAVGKLVSGDAKCRNILTDYACQKLVTG